MERAEATVKTPGEARSRRIQRALAVFTILSTIVVLIGWLFDIVLLKGLKPDWAEMNIPTAISFLAIGLSIFFANGRASQRTDSFKFSLKNSETWSVLFAFVSIPFGVLSILLEVTQGQIGLNLGMGLNTGICSILLGAAIVIFSSRHARAPLISQIFAAVAASIAFFAVIGYLFDVQQLSRMAGYTSMGLHTAVLKLVACAAIFSLEYDWGPMRMIMSPSVGGYMARRLAVAVLLTNLALGWIHVRAHDQQYISPKIAFMLLVFSIIVCTILWISKIGRELSAIEENHRGSERLLSEIINSASACIYVKGLDGNLILANSEYDQMISARRVGIGLNKQSHDEPVLGSAILDASDFKVLRTGQRLQDEESLVVNGQPKTFVASRFPVYDKNDRLMGVGGFWTDITARKNFEEELRQSEEGLRTLSNAIPSIVWTARSDGTMDYFNQRWEEYTGLPPQNDRKERMGVIHPDDADDVLSGWYRAVSAGVPFKGEARIRRKDGEYRWHLLLSRPLKRSNGAVARWFGSITDIDDQKRLAETLERRVQERTKELVNANLELEAFSYSVSHDLRAPLRSMDGFSQILLDRYGSHFDERGRTYLQRVRGASQSMANLIDDLLTLSRIGRTEVVRENVDVSRMAEEIFDEKRKADPNRHVRVEIEPGPTVFADASLVRIALWNLIDNAWKYTSKSLSPSISFKCSEDFDGRTVFTIRDNGVGFEMAHADQLFKAFHRLHSDREFPGTGIGLATAYRILQRHGGAIWAESRPDSGSAFHFYFGQVEQRS